MVMSSLRKLIRMILEDYTPDHGDRVRPVIRPHNKSSERDEVPTFYKKDVDDKINTDDLVDHLQDFDNIDPNGETFGPVPPDTENNPRISLDPFVRDAMPGNKLK
jgi:hypothetical protein